MSHVGLGEELGCACVFFLANFKLGERVADFENEIV
jgi:hypothetical protein